MLLVVRYVLRFWGTVARERRDLVLENIAPRHQLEVLMRPGIDTLESAWHYRHPPRVGVRLVPDASCGG